MLVSIFHTHNQLNSRNAIGMRAMLLAFTFIALALIGFGGAQASSPFTRTQQTANMRVATGSYVGNGTDNRALSGVGFQPDVVIIKGTNNEQAIIHTATMPADLSKEIASGSNQTGAIKTLDADGFTIGTNARVNKATAPNTYYWIAFQAAPGQMALGTYTGNGDAQTISGVGFAPDYVVVLSSQGGHNPLQRSSATSGTTSYFFNGNLQGAHGITALTGDGFNVGGNANVNRNGTLYHYLAWKNTAGSIQVGSYLGNSTGGNPVDDRNITGVGFQPDWVLVRKDGGSASRPLHRSAAVIGDAALEFTGNDPLGDSIQQLNADGFQVGTDTLVNSGNGCSGPCAYFYVAFRDWGNVATATPTHTATVTATFTPTYTDTATPTAAPTETATSVPTATDIPTETPPPSPPNTFQLIDDAVARGEITRDDAAVYKIYALFGVGEPQVPAQFISGEPVPGDGTMLFLEALRDWEQLAPETQQQINEFITPRTPTLLPPVERASKPNAAKPPRLKLSPGTHRVSGIVTRVKEKTMQIRTARGMLNVRVSNTARFVVNDKTESFAKVKRGDRVDGFVHTNKKGRHNAIHFNVRSKTQDKNQSNAPEASGNDGVRFWSEQIVPGADGFSPAVAVDSSHGVHVVWWSATTQSLAYVRWNGSTWSQAGNIPGSNLAGSFGLAIDRADTLHVVWAENGEDASHIYYSSAARNGDLWVFGIPTNYTLNHPAPQYGNVSNPDVAASDQGGQIVVHVVWDEFIQNEDAASFGVRYADANNLGAPIALSDREFGFDTPSLARALDGRVGLAFDAYENQTSTVLYTQCGGGCGGLGNWSPQISVGDGILPDLAFDTGGSAHLVWHQDAVGAHVLYARQPAGDVGWTVPEVVGDVASSEIPLDRPVVSAGTPNNVYVFWTWQSQTVDPNTGMYTIQLKYHVRDGTAWSALLDRGAVNSYNDSNQYVSVDWASNVAHVVWNEGGDALLYASAPQLTVDIGNARLPQNPLILKPVCRLTEYYDTAANFRIYYTRTQGNAPDSPVERDCTVQEPTALINGYPREIVDLGASLEAGYNSYANELGYPAENIYREPSTGRYPVSIGSDPIWSCNDGGLAVDPACWLSASVTFRNRMAFGRNYLDVNLDRPNQPIDYLRSTTAHELFHAIQFTYRPEVCDFGQLFCDQSELGPWMEATAIWASTKARPLCGYCINPTDFLQSPFQPLFSETAPGRQFLFAFFLEEAIANDDPEIIKKIWERFQTNNGGRISTAIDQVLGEPPYNTSLTDASVPFARWNYFLNGGTYRRDVDVYTDHIIPGNPPEPRFVGGEWGLYRWWLTDFGRDNSILFAGALTDRREVNDLPISGPSANYASTVGSFGSAYIEFLPQLNIVPGSSLEVVFFTDEPAGQAMIHGRVEALTLLDFGVLPNPGGDQILPQPNSNDQCL